MEEAVFTEQRIHKQPCGTVQNGIVFTGTASQMDGLSRAQDTSVGYLLLDESQVMQPGSRPQRKADLRLNAVPAVLRDPLRMRPIVRIECILSITQAGDWACV